MDLLAYWNVTGWNYMLYYRGRLEKFVGVEACVYELYSYNTTDELLPILLTAKVEIDARTVIGYKLPTNYLHYVWFLSQ